MGQDSGYYVYTGVSIVNIQVRSSHPGDGHGHGHGMGWVPGFEQRNLITVYGHHKEFFLLPRRLQST